MIFPNISCVAAAMFKGYNVQTFWLSGYLSHYQRLGELFEELSVVSDQSLNPLIKLDTVEAVCEWLTVIVYNA